jgi:NADH dehydrogenase
LIIAIGSESVTRGVQGIENCNFLKSITDARDIRRKLMENFEKANLPTTTHDERHQLLSFVVCGGGKYHISYICKRKMKLLPRPHEIRPQEKYGRSGSDRY